MDTSLFVALHSISGNWFTDALIKVLGDYLLYIVLVAVAYCAYLEYRKRGRERLYHYGVALVAALIARYGVAALIRVFYHRARPFVELQVSHVLNDSAYSFPSGHTIFMFALATAIFMFNKRLGAVLYVCGLIIGIARIAGGVHWPSDVLGGMVLGTLVGCLTVYLFDRFVKKKSPLVSGDETHR